MAKWTINAYTFTSEGSSYPYTIGFHTADLTNAFLTGTLTITIDDTSKVVFTVPYMQGKDLYPGQTLIDIKYGNDRKFFGTVVKKSYENISGIYTFEVTGVLGTYQFMPNYDGYGVDTIENYLATEMSRFKGTASAPYATSNPWTLLYTGHNEIPSTFGDIVTENLSLIPAFNIKIQNTAANAYEFIKLITRQKNYIIPTSVTPKESLHLFEKGEKVHFKRVSGTNTQTVRYDANLISYSNYKKAETSKVFAYNTVDGAYPPYGGWETDRFPIPFNFKRINLSEKTNKTPYTVDEISSETSRLAGASASFEAYAYDQHLLDDSIPWLEMDKYVIATLFVDGAEKTTGMSISQITYDLVDSTKSKVKLGTISNAFITGSEQESQDFQAALKGRLETSGGTMTGGITFDENGNNAEIDTTEISLRDRYALACNLLDSSLIEQGGLSGADGSETALTSGIRSGRSKVSSSTSYTVHWSGALRLYIFEYTSAGAFIKYTLYSNATVESATFTTTSTTGIVRFMWEYSNGATITPSAISSAMLEKGSTASSYLPYTMDGVEVASKLKDWRDCGALVNAGDTVAIPSYATEIRLVPIIQYTHIFQSLNYLWSALSTSTGQNNGCVYESASYNMKFSFTKVNQTLKLESINITGWANGKLAVYVR